MGLVELVLAKYSMEYAVSVVHVHDALEEVLDGGDDGDVSREVKCHIWQDSTETAHHEEEELYNR